MFTAPDLGQAQLLLRHGEALRAAVTAARAGHLRLHKPEQRLHKAPGNDDDDDDDGEGDGNNDDNGEEEEEDEDEKDEGKEEEKGYTPHNHETHGSSHTRPPYTHAFDRHTLHSRSALLTRTLEEPCAKMRSTLHSFVVLLPRICGEVCSLPAERVEALEVLSLRRQQLLPRRPTLRLHL